MDPQSYTIVPGTPGDDTLSTDQSFVDIEAAGGNDVVQATDGATDDILSGGSGDDSFYTDGQRITINGDDGNDQLVSDSGSKDNTMSGGAGDDQFFTDGLRTAIFGGDGADDIGGGSFSRYSVFHGDAGNDSLSTGASYSILFGDDGDDSLTSNASDDIVGNLNTTLSGGAGNDTLLGFQTLSTLDGGDGNDSITAYSGFNSVAGGAGDDTLVSVSGNDSLYGGSGDDVYILHSAATVSEQTVAGVDDGGTDTVIASYSYTLGQFVENLTLADGAMTGNGNALNNVLRGTDATNALDGKAGNDTLYGGGGNDKLTGGAGADDFAFAHFGAANGIDHLLDFVSGVDHLAFTASDFGWTAGHVLTDAELSLTGKAVGATAQFVYNPATHKLAWDSNGSDSGGATSVAVFDNGATPHTGDFVFG